ncbi:hypothetical protein BHE74_00012823 [Ensete ventricosum]|nr:hypothetical protein BHE74_00012823 [Ensete ventricosum]
MFVLPRVEVAAPMKAHWTNLLALACLWNDGPIVVKYARGTLYSSVARQLYGAPSEGLVDQVMKSMVWVASLACLSERNVSLRAEVLELKSSVGLEVVTIAEKRATDLEAKVDQLKAALGSVEQEA